MEPLPSTRFPKGATCSRCSKFARLQLPESSGGPSGSCSARSMSPGDIEGLLLAPLPPTGIRGRIAYREAPLGKPVLLALQGAGGAFAQILVENATAGAFANLHLLPDRYTIRSFGREHFVRAVLEDGEPLAAISSIWTSAAFAICRFCCRGDFARVSGRVKKPESGAPAAFYRVALRGPHGGRRRSGRSVRPLSIRESRARRLRDLRLARCRTPSSEERRDMAASRRRRALFSRGCRREHRDQSDGRQMKPPAAALLLAAGAFAQEPAGVIAGTVRSALSRRVLPSTGIELTLNPASDAGQRAVLHAAADIQGVFRFAGLPAGEGRPELFESGLRGRRQANAASRRRAGPRSQRSGYRTAAVRRR